MKHKTFGAVYVDEDVEFVNFGLAKSGFRSVDFETLYDSKITVLNPKLGTLVKSAEWGLPSS